MKRQILIAAALLVSACSSEPAKPDIQVEDVWARAVPMGQPNGAAYMTITNKGDAPDKLLSMSASVAKHSMLHETKMVNGVSSMGAAGAIDIPAGGEVKLAPGGLHLMMMDLSVPLSPGDRFFVDMEFEKSGHETVSGKVVAAGER